MVIKIRKVDDQFLFLDIFYFYGARDVKAQYHKKNNVWTYRSFNVREGAYSDIYSPTKKEYHRMINVARKYILKDVLK